MIKVYGRKVSIVKLVLLASGFVLMCGLAIYLNNRQSMATPDLPEPPLKELAAKHRIPVGNFAIPSRLDEKPYDTILKEQFDFILADNQPNWHFTDHSLRPAPDKFDFSRLDEVISYGKTNNMAIQAHHYVWGEEKWLPDWLKNGNYSDQQVLEFMKNHIAVVGARYSGQIREWTVVNEAFSRATNIYGLRDWWADNTGGMAYIDEAFLAAKKADPKSKLILNDFGNEAINDISNAMYDYVKNAKQRGIPIDGIGMQMHIDGTHPPTKDEVKSNIQRFGELGVDTYITEFDVNMNDVKASDDSKKAIQGNIYYEMARACIESKYCRSFALLGITDKETWYNYMGLNKAMPLPFDEDYQPKPAFWSLRQAFSEGS